MYLATIEKAHHHGVYNSTTGLTQPFDSLKILHILNMSKYKLKLETCMKQQKVSKRLHSPNYILIVNEFSNCLKGQKKWT